MPTRKIDNIPPLCHDNEHEPPNMMVFEDGLYEHECPSCHHKQIFRVNKPTLSVAPLGLKGRHG